MPKIAVDECPAGPAMDAAVAKALGFNIVLHHGQRMVRFLADPEFSSYLCCDPAPYSTDIAAAWGLVGWCSTNLGLLATLIEWREGWNVNFSDGSETYSSFEDTEACPLAISRAFLKANGVEFVEVPE